MLNFRRLMELLAQPRPQEPATVSFMEQWLAKWLPGRFTKDTHDNFVCTIGEPTCMFTAHYDTMDTIGIGAATKNPKKLRVTYPITTDLHMPNTSNGTVSLAYDIPGEVLGADCGAGIEVLLCMIEGGIPGTYVLFAGEERGCQGSKDMASKWVTPNLVTKCISFDRVGTKDVISTQGFGEQCASPAFIKALCDALGMGHKPADGSYTDSYSFIDKIPECTNISTGYYQCHTNKETLDLGYLDKLILKCLEVQWETLPVQRNPDDAQSKSRWGSGYIPIDGELFYTVTEYPDVTAEFLEQFGLEEEYLDYVQEKAEETKAAEALGSGYGYCGSYRHT